MSWIRGFLVDRKEQVMVNGSSLEWCSISGVPQGSVLGPLLFTIIVSNMPELMDNYIFMFVDDTKLFLTLEQQDSQHSLQSDIDKLQTCLQDADVLPPENAVMHLGSNNTQRNYTRSTNNGIQHPLLVVEAERDLRVIIDNKY